MYQLCIIYNQICKIRLKQNRIHYPKKKLKSVKINKLFTSLRISKGKIRKC